VICCDNAILFKSASSSQLIGPEFCVRNDFGLVVTLCLISLPSVYVFRGTLSEHYLASTTTTTIFISQKPETRKCPSKVVPRHKLKYRCVMYMLNDITWYSPVNHNHSFVYSVLWGTVLA